jgi:hypothetical protein
VAAPAEPFDRLNLLATRLLRHHGNEG